MELSHKNKRWPTYQESPLFMENFRKHDQFIGEAKRQAKIWMSVSLTLGIITIGLIATILYLSAQPRLIPHVIEIAPWGEAKNVGTVGENLSPDTIPRTTQSIHYYLRQFVHNTRGITTDASALRQNLVKALDATTSQSYAKLLKEIQDGGVFVKAQNGRTEITIYTILQTTQSTYQIDWAEKDFNKTGDKINDHLYRGLFTLTFAQPTSKQRENNPLGIFIDSYDITQIEREAVLE